MLKIKAITSFIATLSTLLSLASYAIDPHDKVRIRTLDDFEFAVEYQYIKASNTLEHLIEDAGIENEIPLNNINGKIFSNIVAIIKAFMADGLTSVEKKLEVKDNEFLIELVKSANFLDIKVVTVVKELVVELDLTTFVLSKLANRFKSLDTDSVEKLASKLSKSLQRLLARGEDKNPIMQKWLSEKIEGNELIFILDKSFLGFSLGQDWKFRIKRGGFLEKIWDALPEPKRQALQPKVEIVD